MKVPRLTGWALRAALIYLALGFTLGGTLLFNKGVPLHPMLWTLLPAHIEFLLVGWMAQLTLAMAFWIAPRFGDKRPKRGNVPLAWAGIISLNLGVLLVSIAPFLPGSQGLKLAGRGAELAGVLIFGIYLWPRIKSWKN